MKLTPRNLQRWIVCLVFAAAVQPASAQTKYTLNLDTPLSTNTGAILYWQPSSASFRAGYDNGPQANLGFASAAFGQGQASGSYSFAAGEGYSTGSFSSAFGLATQANGFGAFSAGADTYASGDMSTAFGNYSYAFGSVSTAFGSSTMAYGDLSMTWGGSTAAWGVASTAFGILTTANAYGSLAIGRYNIGAYTQNSNPSQSGERVWYPGDPIFEIGNGTAWNDRSNAFTVYKNGNADFQGVVRVAPGGDIPMFNAP